MGEQLKAGSVHPRSGPAPAARALAVRLLASAMAALLLLGSANASETTPRGARVLRRIPLVFHVAERAGEAVAPGSFLAEQLAAANEVYGPLGIELVDTAHVPLEAAHAELVTRSDRDALARQVRKGAIHCFVVARLMDVDEPGRERRGVHWHPPRPGQSFLIVSKISMRYVLAHELGHLFGNPKHSDVPGNLMSYTRTELPPFLDRAQVRRVQRTLALLLKEGTLVPLAPLPNGASAD